MSLINVEAGINVEGGQNVEIHDCGGWNKRGGWAFLSKIVNVEGVKTYQIKVEGGNQFNNCGRYVNLYEIT